MLHSDSSAVSFADSRASGSASDFADLHVHTFFSDGSNSPQEIVQSALENGVTLLAVADHDLVAGSIETQRLCKEAKIDFIPAVEIDSMHNGKNFHILGYDCNNTDSNFLTFLSHLRYDLDESNVSLLYRMIPDYPQMSRESYESFRHDKTLGGWKMLHYLMYVGITNDVFEGIPFYGQYDISYSMCGYPSIESVCYSIEQAGGYAVLAHPGELIDSDDIAEFEKELREVVSHGVSGIECYYPSHSKEVTEVCLKLCDELDLYITSGSDCHGKFGRRVTQVGEMKTSRSMLRLR